MSTIDEVHGRVVASHAPGAVEEPSLLAEELPEAAMIEVVQ